MSRYSNYNGNFDKPKPPYHLTQLVFDNYVYKLFVYGNLKMGFPMHNYLNKQKFLGPAISRASYLLYDFNGVPGLVEDYPLGIKISGELYEIDAECLRRIDYAEGEGSLYKRDTISLDTPDIKWPEQVWTYYALTSVKGMTHCGPVWPPEK